MGKKIWFSIIGMAMLAAALGGCGEKNKELPADTPWNSGHYAIMETKNGYYSNLVGQQYLHYYEKETGTDIFLCAKPECRHDGDETCIATYRNMKTINSVLYDGMIYILAVENRDHVVSFNLYKAALDGSALDKVAEVFPAANTSGEDIYLAQEFYLDSGDPAAFIIHKGYAYVPFFMAFNWSAKGFVNGGIMKVDLQTGQAEQIYQMDKLTGLYPTRLWGCGDYLYYNLDSANGNASRRGTYRYRISDGSEEYVAKVLWPDEKRKDFQIGWVTEDEVFYKIAWDEEKRLGLWRYERKDEELLSGMLFPLEESDGKGARPVLYEDQFFFYGEDGVSLYDMDGNRLGGIAYDFPGADWEIVVGSSSGPALNISGGKLYASLLNQKYDPYGSDPFAYPRYDVFACAIEELAGGRGKWEPVYSAYDLHPEHMHEGRIMRGD